MRDGESRPVGDMPPKMRKFLSRPPTRLGEEAIGSRRNKAIRRSKPKGWLTELCELQAWRCAYCRRSMAKKRRDIVNPNTATLDHVLPISRGGRNQRSNLVAACSSCNQKKGAMTAEEFEAATSATTNAEERNHG